MLVLQIANQIQINGGINQRFTQNSKKDSPILLHWQRVSNPNFPTLKLQSAFINVTYSLILNMLAESAGC